jgi:DNA invertase Pin-like site-specific DNA recombinase
VSKDDQTSVPEQLEWAVSAARVGQIELTAVFEDLGIPGSIIDRRPGLQELLEHVESQASRGTPCNVVFVWDVDRLSRADSLETAAVLLRLRRAGVARLITASGTIDLHSSNDRLLFGIQQEAQRSAFSPKLARDVLRSQAAGARAGKRQGGPIPCGYRTDGGKLVPGDAKEVEFIGWLFRTYDETPASTWSLSRDSWILGYRTRRGGRFSSDAICRILRNRVYLGEIEWNRKPMGRFAELKGGRVETPAPTPPRPRRGRAGGRYAGRSRKAEPGDVISVAGQHDPLVCEERYNRVQSKLLQNQKKTSPCKDHPSALRGLGVCAACGAPCYPVMQTNPSAARPNPVGARLVCSVYRVGGAAACLGGGWAKVADVEREVVRILQAHLGQPSAVAALRRRAAQEATQQQQHADARRGELTRRLTALDADLTRCRTRLLEVDADLLPDAQQALREKKEAREALVLAIGQHEADVRAAQVGADPADLERALGLIERLHELAAAADPAVLGEALQALVSRVRIRFTRTGPGRGPRGKRQRFGVPKIEVTLQRSFSLLLHSGRRTR